MGNPEEDSSFLHCLDANNLYGWDVIQPLPTGGFNWVDPSEFTPDKLIAMLTVKRVIC